MLKIKVINRIDFSAVENMNLQKDLEKIAQNIIIPDIERGIDSGVAIVGGQLPHNEPATIKRKGHSRQLIETGKLKSSFFYKTSGKNKVIISISGNRKAIGGYLQDGIMTKSGSKQYVFFGISKDAEDGARDYMNKRISEVCKNASGKR